MTRSSTRQAIADFLAPPAVSLVASVFPHPPKVTSEAQFFVGLTPEAGSGVVIYIMLEDQAERRIALGGTHNGRKWRQYTCALTCFLRCASKDAEQADTDNDTFLDSLTGRIQSDRNLGTAAGPNITAGSIFQAGEGGDRGGDDLHIRSGLPVPMNGGITQILNVVRFAVVEILDT